MRHLHDEDLDAIGVLIEVKIYNRLSEMESHIMSTLADLLAEDAELTDEVNQIVVLLNEDTQLIKDLQGTIGSGNLTPDQQTAVDSLFAQIGASRDQIKAAIAGDTAPPAVVPFVVKFAGETFADYTARVSAYNADAANVSNQVTATDEASWDALPVG